MKLSIVDKSCIWMALASYVEECQTLAEVAEEENVITYYARERKEAIELRKRFRADLSRAIPPWLLDEIELRNRFRAYQFKKK